LSFEHLPHLVVELQREIRNEYELFLPRPTQLQTRPLANRNAHYVWSQRGSISDLKYAIFGDSFRARLIQGNARHTSGGITVLSDDA
jgi:hypothetical protein